MTVLLPGTAARAEPSVSEVEHQIDDEWAKLEPIVEQYNLVHGQLQANQTKAATLQKQLQPLEAQVDAAMGKFEDIAAGMYKNGPASALTAVLTTGSPTTLADKLDLLDYLARTRRAEISGVLTLRDRYEKDKKTVDDLVALQAKQDETLAVQKKDIEARMDSLQKLRQQAYGTSGAIGALRTGPCPAEYYPTPGGRAAAKACSLIGKPYIWGAAGPRGYDCSGLTLAAWASVGVTLRHYTGWQWDDAKPVSRANLQPGDLVFYFSDLHHMAMYVGGGMVVHAPTTGDVVRMRKLDGMPIAGFRRPG